MSHGWYFTTGGQAESGPVSAAELRRLAKAGVLAPADLVRREGSDRKVLAGSVDGLFPPIPARPVPPPPQAAPVPARPVARATPVVAPAAAHGDTARTDVPPVVPAAGERAPGPTPTPESAAGAAVPPASRMGLGRRGGSSRRTLVALGGVGAAAVLFACCGGMALVGFLTGRPPDGELTADYYPHKPGLDRAFTRRTFDVAFGSGPPVDTRWRVVHHSDGTIETVGPPPFNVRESVKYRQADGYVELGLRDGRWEPVLKLGAKSGERWERGGRTYTLKEFARYNGAWCAVVREESMVEGLRKETLYWYAKGDGLVRQEDRIEKGGEMKLLAVMTVEGVDPGGGTGSKYDWGPKAPEAADTPRHPEDKGGGVAQGQRGPKVYTVKVESRTVRVEVAGATADEIDLSDLVYNRRDGRIDLKVKLLTPVGRRYTKWRYTLFDKGGVALASSELIHPNLGVGQTGMSYLYLGSDNKDKVVRISVP